MKLQQHLIPFVVVPPAPLAGLLFAREPSQETAPSAIFLGLRFRLG